MTLPAALSPAQLAALAVPGLPSSPRGVRLRIQSDNWMLLPTSGTRGQLLIDVATLPQEVRNAIARRMAALADRVAPDTETRRQRGRPRGTDFFAANPATAEAVRGIVSQFPHAATTIMDLLRAGGYPLPSIFQLRRFIRELEARQAAVIAALRDPDDYKSRYRVALGNADGGVTAAHQIWELDTTKADVMTVGGRIMVLGVIDRWSRRTKFIVAPSESGLAVRRLLRETILHWGVMPRAVVTDNGSGYVNATIRSALDALGIEHIICPPGSPERKPFVERVFGTFMRSRARLLDGFTGHNVAQAQRLRAVAKKKTGRAEITASYTSDELQRILDAWVDGAYHQSPHRSLGMTPMAKWLSSPEPARRAVSTEELDRALSARVGVMLIGKRGLQWKRGRYWAPELAAWVGRSVHVRRVEDDLGALLVFDEDGNFICTAVNAERAGLSEQAFAMAARAHQDDYMRAAKAELRRQQRAVDLGGLNQRLLREDAERAGVVVPISAARPATERPDTHHIDAAPAEPLPFAPPANSALSMADRAARAEAILADVEAGQPVEAERIDWARAFIAGPSYAAHRAREGTALPLPHRTRS